MSTNVQSKGVRVKMLLLCTSSDQKCFYHENGVGIFFWNVSNHHSKISGFMLFHYSVEAESVKEYLESMQK